MSVDSADAGKAAGAVGDTAAAAAAAATAAVVEDGTRSSTPSTPVRRSVSSSAASTPAASPTPHDRERDDMSVRVFARFRPLVERERKSNESVRGFDVKFSDDHTSVAVFGEELFQSRSLSTGKQIKPHQFTFDRVFPPGSSQESVFEHLARGVVDDVIEGYNGTVFAYGQTGSGKTYSMFGAEDKDYGEKMGVIPQAAAYLFRGLRHHEDIEEVTIKASFLEIYKEKIMDLLNPNNQKLRVRQVPRAGVQVVGLVEEYITEPEELIKLIEIGERCRSISYTDMNAVSSRSHTILTVTVQQKLKDGSMRQSKLNLADLAGSERVGKTNATGNTLLEAQKINQSLSALGNCINALSKGNKKSHIPFRDSRLTFLLKDSLGGNTKTTLLVTCSPHASCFEETLSTLKFAQRAKHIQNTAHINRELSTPQLRTLVQRLKSILAQRDSKIASLKAQLKSAGRAVSPTPESTVSPSSSGPLRKQKRRNSSNGGGAVIGSDQDMSLLSTSVETSVTSSANSTNDDDTDNDNDEHLMRYLNQMGSDDNGGMDQSSQIAALNEDIEDLRVDVADKGQRLEAALLFNELLRKQIQIALGKERADKVIEYAASSAASSRANSVAGDQSPHFSRTPSRHGSRAGSRSSSPSSLSSRRGSMRRSKSTDSSGGPSGRFGRSQTLRPTKSRRGSQTPSPGPASRKAGASSSSASKSRGKMRKSPSGSPLPSVHGGDGVESTESLQTRLLEEISKNAKLEREMLRLKRQERGRSYHRRDEEMDQSWASHLDRALQHQHFKDQVSTNASHPRIVRPVSLVHAHRPRRRSHLEREMRAQSTGMREYRVDLLPSIEVKSPDEVVMDDIQSLGFLEIKSTLMPLVVLRRVVREELDDVPENFVFLRGVIPIGMRQEPKRTLAYVSTEDDVIRIRADTIDPAALLIQAAKAESNKHDADESPRSPLPPPPPTPPPEDDDDDDGGDGGKRGKRATGKKAGSKSGSGVKGRGTNGKATRGGSKTLTGGSSTGKRRSGTLKRSSTLKRASKKATIDSH